MPDDITHNISARRFEMNVHGQLALVDYRLKLGVIVYSHAEVPREHWGRGHDVAPKFYPIMSSFWRLDLASWPGDATGSGAEPSA